MKRVLTLALLIPAAVLPIESVATVITVDASGGGDYLTIQEGVDAASMNDTVLVYPGIYADVVDCGGYGIPACVCIRYSSVTLISQSGPEDTIIECDNGTQLGVMCEGWMPATVTGFTVRRGDAYPWGTGIVLQDGEISGNVVTGFALGISTDDWVWADEGAHSVAPFDPTIVIADNTIEGNTSGIYARLWGANTALVSGNTVIGNDSGGIAVYGTGDIALVGNEISDNSWGVTIENPSHTAGAVFSVDFSDNRICDNIHQNVVLHMSEIAPGTQCQVTLGGSQGAANDIYGAPVNLYASAYNVDLQIDATYNFWGSVACSTFVPLFDIQENVPDTAFVFEPFVDETHLIVYENCEGIAVENESWGSIKALFR